MDRPLEDEVLERLVNRQAVEQMVLTGADTLYLISYFRLVISDVPHPQQRLAELHDMPPCTVAHWMGRVRAACLSQMPEECEYHPRWNRSTETCHARRKKQ